MVLLTLSDTGVEDLTSAAGFNLTDHFCQKAHGSSAGFKLFTGQRCVQVQCNARQFLEIHKDIKD